MKFKFLFIMVGLFASYSCFSQNEEKSPILKTGIELGSGFSFTGINTNLAYTLTLKDDLIFVGPKLSVTDSYLPAKGPWGIHLGYRRVLPGLGKIRSFASVEYQVVFTKPYNPNGLDVKGLNKTNEIHFSYGLQYQWTGQIIVGNTLGAGWYTENLIDLDTGKRNQYHGFSPQVRLFIQYHFKKEN